MELGTPKSVFYGGHSYPFVSLQGYAGDTRAARLSPGLMRFREKLPSGNWFSDIWSAVSSDRSLYLLRKPSERNFVLALVTACVDFLKQRERFGQLTHLSSARPAILVVVRSSSQLKELTSVLHRDSKDLPIMMGTADEMVEKINSKLLSLDQVEKVVSDDLSSFPDISILKNICELVVNAAGSTDGIGTENLSFLMDTAVAVPEMLKFFDSSSLFLTDDVIETACLLKTEIILVSDVAPDETDAVFFDDLPLNNSAIIEDEPICSSTIILREIPKGPREVYRLFRSILFNPFESHKPFSIYIHLNDSTPKRLEKIHDIYLQVMKKFPDKQFDALFHEIKQDRESCKELIRHGSCSRPFYCQFWHLRPDVIYGHLNRHEMKINSSFGMNIFAASTKEQELELKKISERLNTKFSNFRWNQKINREEFVRGGLVAFEHLIDGQPTYCRASVVKNNIGTDSYNNSICVLKVLDTGEILEVVNNRIFRLGGEFSLDAIPVTCWTVIVAGLTKTEHETEAIQYLNDLIEYSNAKITVDSIAALRDHSILYVNDIKLRNVSVVDQLINRNFGFLDQKAKRKIQELIGAEERTVELTEDIHSSYVDSVKDDESPQSSFEVIPEVVFDQIDIEDQNRDSGNGISEIPEEIEEVVPEGLKEDVVPEGLKEEVVPEGLKEEVVSEGLKEEVVPGGPKEEVVPEEEVEVHVPGLRLDFEVLPCLSRDERVTIKKLEDELLKNVPDYAQVARFTPTALEIVSPESSKTVEVGDDSKRTLGIHLIELMLREELLTCGNEIAQGLFDTLLHFYGGHISCLTRKKILSLMYIDWRKNETKYWKETCTPFYVNLLKVLASQVYANGNILQPSIDFLTLQAFGFQSNFFPDYLRELSLNCVNRIFFSFIDYNHVISEVERKEIGRSIIKDWFVPLVNLEYLPTDDSDDSSIHKHITTVLKETLIFCCFDPVVEDLVPYLTKLTSINETFSSIEMNTEDALKSEEALGRGGIFGKVISNVRKAKTMLEFRKMSGAQQVDISTQMSNVNTLPLKWAEHRGWIQLKTDLPRDVEVVKSYGGLLKNSSTLKVAVLDQNDRWFAQTIPLAGDAINVKLASMSKRVIKVRLNKQFRKQWGKLSTKNTFLHRDLNADWSDFEDVDDENDGGFDGVPPDNDDEIENDDFGNIMDHVD